MAAIVKLRTLPPHSISEVGALILALIQIISFGREMRFFFEFVSCCVPVNMSRTAVSEATPPQADEMRSLTPQTTRKHRRRRRSASWSSDATMAADWKPSLGAISEDKVVVVVMERTQSDDPDRRSESERSVKRKSGSGDSRFHNRNHSDDFGRNPAATPLVIQAFSPTPFLF